MKRALLPTNAFLRSARRLTRKNPVLAEDLQITLELLAKDAFDPRLKAHKLKGQFSASWACSAGYDLRIVFQFVKHKGQKAILLEAAGTHDEIY
ncbi:MAG: type II toxin-antitoxin system YafQ family toxin [Verrucomicrobia bacterium]|nr:type II toxin-antitoxin system YafQ family toxin [Verrucomicrobiota bacterium]